MRDFGFLYQYLMLSALGTWLGTKREATTSTGTCGAAEEEESARKQQKKQKVDRQRDRRREKREAELEGTKWESPYSPQPASSPKTERQKLRRAEQVVLVQVLVCNSPYEVRRIRYILNVIT